MKKSQKYVAWGLIVLLSALSFRGLFPCSILTPRSRLDKAVKLVVYIGFDVLAQVAQQHRDQKPTIGVSASDSGDKKLEYFYL